MVSLQSVSDMNDFMASSRIIDEDRKEDFFNKGYKRRYFLPHEVYYIPKCGVDGLRLAHRMWNINNPDFLWEIILYAGKSSIAEFPREIFFDEDIIWHQQHLGKVGQIATANLIVNGKILYTLEHISDLVQRIYLRKEFRTRVNSCYKYWHHMLLNSILNFAVEYNLKLIYSPTSSMLVKKLYPEVNRKYFDRIYDRDVKMHFEVDQKNGMWIIDVEKNRHKLVPLKKKKEILKNNKKTICIFHDIERRLGYEEVETDLVKMGNKSAAESLEKMLNIEKEINIKTTYNVVGSLMNEVRTRIERDGHCVAFHSYNHQKSIQPTINYKGEAAILNPISEVYYKVVFCMNIVRKLLSLPLIRYQTINEVYRNAVNKVRRQLSLLPVINQLAECRNVEYRIKGYKHYESQISYEIKDNDLCFYNFEWLATDEKTTGAEPILQNRIVKIPIFYDDQEMYKKNIPYRIWEKKIIEGIKKRKFVAIGLHDCYAHYWLTNYADLLRKIGCLGQFKTFNEVANQVFLANAV